MRKVGFTLIELLVVIGIIGILAAVVLVAVNPGRQFAASRDTGRNSDLNSLIKAAYQYAVENNGSLPTDLSTVPTELGTCGGCVNLTDELVPTFMTAIPMDPSTGTLANTGYYVNIDLNGRMMATAASELNPGTNIQIAQ